ncbi:MAG: cytochrome c oxidase subunit II [Blastocatellia bacterium]
MLLQLLSHLYLSPWAPFMPDAKSNFAESIDLLYGFIWWTMTFFFVIITFLCFYFPYKYRRGKVPALTPRITHNLALELLWSGVPTLLLIVIAFWGVNLFVQAYVPPGEAHEINVTGKQWAWSFEHPDGTVDGKELWVPLGKPIKLVMSSTDVLHSFFIPDFRVKSDVVPGRYTNIWFTPREVGEHQVFCTEYCGKDHSYMLGTVKVVTPEAYKDYLDNGSPDFRALPPEQRGALLYTKRGCNSCHTVDGSPLVGPSFKGLFGRTEYFIDGSSLVVDENYIMESINNPQAKIVKGFEGQAMPSFQGQLKKEQFDAIIAYIKTLK